MSHAGSPPVLAVPAESAAEQASAAASPLLRVANLRKVFRSGPAEIAVLTGVNLDVQRGEMISIVGPSGAGKSTLLHLVAALDTPTSGTVYFDGQPLESLAEAQLAEFRNRRVAFVWQRHHLLPDFTAAENVAMPLLLRGVPQAEALRSARRWLQEAGLEARADHYAGQLSGGEQQRAAIARALVAEPALLLADEPTGDLDEQNTEAIFDLMQRLHRSHRLTSLLATHNLALARRCDRALRLEHGLLQPWSPSAAGGGPEVSRPEVPGRDCGERHV
jgi:lipoprotein-releasing system ATP-binding protein